MEQLTELMTITTNWAVLLTVGVLILLAIGAAFLLGMNVALDKKLTDTMRELQYEEDRYLHLQKRSKS